MLKSTLGIFPEQHLIKNWRKVFAAMILNSDFPLLNIASASLPPDKTKVPGFPCIFHLEMSHAYLLFCGKKARETGEFKLPQ